MQPYLSDPDFTLYVGDALETLRELDSESANCAVTSPPYWGLRNYGVDRQLGLEPTPDQYIANMVAVFAEVRRVLRKDGTCWINIGDSYNAGTSATRINPDERWNAEFAGRTSHTGRLDVPGLKPKDLVGIPWQLAFALRADGWYLRSEIIWAKPNPMPESVTDRPTKAHEQIFLLTRSPRYWFDADAIREPVQEGNTPNGRENAAGIESKRAVEREALGALRGGRGWKVAYNNPAGRNARTVWEIATEPYPDAHFATFPTELARRCILAGCPEFVCGTCGKPRERIVRHTGDYAGRATEQPYRHLLDPTEFGAHLRERREALGLSMSAVDAACKTNTACSWWEGRANGYQLPSAENYRTLKPLLGLDDRFDQYFESTAPTRPGWTTGANADGFINDKRGVSTTKETKTVGWSDCGHGNYQPGVVLDPFLGSGTVALVARNHGRRSIGIELSADYAALAARRLQQLSLLAEATPPTEQAV